MKKQWIWILFSLALSAAAWSGWGLGFTGAAFDLGASARSLGLGSAFAALVDDETAVIHNPAALGHFASVGLSSLYVRQFGGIGYGSVSIAMPWLGVNLSLLDSGLIPSVQGEFRYASQAIAISGGVPIGPIGIGLRWRYVRVSSPGSGSGWTIAPALLVDAGTIRVAAIWESAYSMPLSYESGASESFDPSLRVGMAATLSPSPEVWWNATFEASGLFADEVRFAAGLEAWIGSIGSRVGYDGVGPTFGLTARLAGLQLDWAYALRSDLGGSHRASLTFRF